MPKEQGGLGGVRSGHFGHCDVFTLVDVEDGKIKEVTTLPNQEHAQGGCMIPVNLLSENNVNALIVGGIGMRPLMGFVIRLALAALPTSIRRAACALFPAETLAVVPCALVLGITAAVSLPSAPGSFSLRSCSVSLWHATHLLCDTPPVITGGSRNPLERGLKINIQCPVPNCQYPCNVSCH